MTSKITLQMKYRKGAMVIKQDSLPRLRHTPSEFIVKRAEILSSGHALLDGEEVEFQDIRIFLKSGVIDA